jgi:hypothetical protein
MIRFSLNQIKQIKVLQVSIKRRCGTWHNDIQHNDTEHNDTKLNDTEYNGTQHNVTQNNDTQQNDIKHFYKNLDTHHYGIYHNDT